MFNGVPTDDRTGTGTFSVFGRQLRFDLSQGFPLLTTKKLFTRGIFEELLWFLSGDTNEKTLAAKKVNIWKEWTPKGAELSLQERIELWRTGNYGVCNPAQAENSHEDLDKLGVPRHAEGSGDLGRIYGAQWRNWKAAKELVKGSDEPPYEIVRVDQIAELIDGLTKNPGGRRHIVTAWNPGELDQMALPPCHCLFQFHTAALTLDERSDLYDRNYLGIAPDKSKVIMGEDWHKRFDEVGIPKHRLSCQLYQRSALSAIAA